MRAAAIFGLGASAAELRPFQRGSTTTWLKGIPAFPADADAILIFGGDGTLHRLLPDLVRLNLPVLIVPAGSGNDFARALQLRSKRDSLRVWRAFESGTLQPRPVDLGTVIPTGDPKLTHYFCTVAACGLDALVARRANKMPRWLRGRGGYVLALLSTLRSLPKLDMQMKMFNPGDEPKLAEGSTLLAAFANSQFYGHGMRIAPRASFTDGRLDICRISSMAAHSLLSVFPTVYFGKHVRSSTVDCAVAQRVLLQTATPEEIYADGEFICKTPAEISVAPLALKTLSPEP